jgi:hypothetical protein
MNTDYIRDIELLATDAQEIIHFINERLDPQNLSE